MTEDIDQAKASLKEFGALLEYANEHTKEGLAKVKAASAKVAATNEYVQVTLPIKFAKIERDAALDWSRSWWFQMSAEDKAILAQYGLETEGTLKSIFKLGANRRDNKAKLQKIEQGEDRKLAKAQATLDAATKAADEKLAKNLKARAPGA